MRVAMAQLNPIVGDVAGNTALVIEAIDAARRDNAQVLITSELVVLGYPPRDLIQREGIVEACEAAVLRIAAHAKDMHVIVGHPRRIANGSRPFRNSASICHQGRVIAVCDKQLLPGYDVFDEDRYFEPGEQSCLVEILGRRVGVVICEDLWRARDVDTPRRYPVEPLAELVACGCELLISLNASPFVIGKCARHEAQLSSIATQARLPIIAVNQVGANDDLVFDGRSVVFDSAGALRERLPGFRSAVQMVEIDTAAEPGHRASKPASNERPDPNREVWHALVLGVHDYCRKTGHRQVNLGLSGGIDSALTAVIAAAAIGASNVHGVMMPSRYSSAGSISDSLDLAQRIGMKHCQEISIRDLHESMARTVHAAIGKAYEGVPDENVQARLRGVMLMALSNATNSLVLATSNKSEMAVGYSTLYGDMCGALAVLGDLTKTRIYALCAWINANFAECGFSRPPIPANSITKPPSAELRPNQTDQDTLPPYEVLDAIIEGVIEREQSPEEIVETTGISAELVNKTLRMIDRAQYKRDQAPVVLKVTSRAFGPGRPMPIVMRTQVASAGAPAPPIAQANIMPLPVDR